MILGVSHQMHEPRGYYFSNRGTCLAWTADRVLGNHRRMVLRCIFQIVLSVATPVRTSAWQILKMLFFRGSAYQKTAYDANHNLCHCESVPIPESVFALLFMNPSPESWGITFEKQPRLVIFLGPHFFYK